MTVHVRHIGIAFCLATFSLLFWQQAKAEELIYVQEDLPPNVEGVLSQLQKAWHVQNSALAKRTALQNAIDISGDETITVILEPEPDKSSYSIDEVALRGLGGEILNRSNQLIKASVPISKLSEVAQVSGVTFVRRPYIPVAENVISEGVSLIQAPVFYNAGFGGKGVKIGVIDSGFEGAFALESQGELPISGYIDFTGTGLTTEGPHGTACAEIVHDIAPEAELYLYKIDDLVDLAKAKDAAIQTGVDIITNSLGWSGGGIGDGKGRACQIVNEAFANGVLWVKSAGNYGQQQYSGVLRDQSGNGFHEFGDGIEILRLEGVRAGQEIVLWLAWDDWPLTVTNYDLLLYRIFPDGRVAEVARANTPQFKNPPEERIRFVVEDEGDYGFAVWKAPEASNKIFKVLSNSHDIEQFASVRGSISIPGDALGALAVGAIDYKRWTSGPVEAFSSRGPTFDNRIKPDIVAPDRVSTISYGPNSFPGTSAAAPHVAGAAALLQASNPVYYTPSKLKSALITSAIDMGEPGPDNLYGAGRLSMASLLNGAPQMVLSHTELDFGSVIIGNRTSSFFNVLNDGTIALVIDQIQVPSQIYTISESAFVLSPQKSRIITIDFEPSNAGDFTGNLVLHTNDPNRSNVTVNLLGVGSQVPIIPKPELALDVLSVDFGEVLVGDYGSQVVRMINQGDAPLEILNIQSSATQFYALSAQLTIPSKSSRLIEVRFAPTSARSHEAQLILLSNDSEHPSVSLPLFGHAKDSGANFSIALDVDLELENQIYQVDDGREIAIRIMGENIRGAVGFTAQVVFDTTQVVYDRLELSTDIPDAASPGAYVMPQGKGIEVTAASLGNTIPVTEGLLGTIWLRPKAEFSNTIVTVAMGRLRRNRKFEIFDSPLHLTVARKANVGKVGDFDRDGHVGFADFLAFASAYGSQKDQEGYNISYDLDGNGEVGFSDFLIFTQNFGKS